MLGVLECWGGGEDVAVITEVCLNRMKEGVCTRRSSSLGKREKLVDGVVRAGGE